MSEQDLPAQLVAILDATRRAERDIFGALPPDVRDAPLPGRDWSPKDHQAHLSAWKARQAERYVAARSGRDLPITAGEETDEINAQLHAKRVDWSWEAVEREAESVSLRLNEEILATDADTIRASDTLLRGTFGNGAYHAQQHFGWLLEADVGIEPDRVVAFVDEVEDLVRGANLPEPQRAESLYNLACFHALAGRLHAARPLLREAFAVRNDLREWALTDPDLAALAAELDALAGQ